MSSTPAVHCISELHDLFLLRVPSTRVAKVTADLSSSTPSMNVEWSVAEELHISSILEAVIDSLSGHYPTVAIAQPVVAVVGDGTKRFEVFATDVEDVPDAPMDVGEGEPIPSDTSFPVSFAVGDVAFDIASYDGMTYTLLRNGEELEGDYSSIAAAVGALLQYVLFEIADREAQKGTPNPEQTVDKDFLFELSKFLRKSPIIPDESVRKYLVDFVELTTHRDFDA